MRFSIRWSVCSLLMVACVIAVAAQSPGGEEKLQYAGWQKIEIGRVSFYAPKELKPSERMPLDLGYYYYKSGDLVLEIATGPNAFGPTDKTKLPNFSHRSQVVNGARAWIWYYDGGEGEFTHAAGARFTAEGPDKYAVTITMRSKAGGLKEVAEKVFMSVRFDPEGKAAAGGRTSSRH